MMLHFLITGKANCLLQKCLYISAFSKWRGRNAGVWGELTGCAGIRGELQVVGCRFQGKLV
ncbi:hypothetical protein A4R26_15430 [Niastella populi]|uniref:Uncharacterized protein n=1 Tax=Niastella populi TaxID=550983 RepID=A0A1V9G3F4_9BACT|nr:hypothetical protein A4R26_15430 [Niastella populi]